MKTTANQKDYKSCFIFASKYLDDPLSLLGYVLLDDVLWTESWLLEDMDVLHLAKS